VKINQSVLLPYVIRNSSLVNSNTRQVLTNCERCTRNDD